MKRRIHMLSFILIILFLSTISHSFSAISLEKQTNDNISNSHIIENVPYFYQKEIHYCELASFEMVLKYYGYNFSQTELLYLTGGGYSFAYNPTFESIINTPRFSLADQVLLYTDEITAGTDDLKLFSELYGLDFRYIYPEKITSHEKTWDEYWEMLKDYVSRDIPVITGLDPVAWPPYMQSINLTFTPPKMFGSSHIVVVLGFNEENNTVCVNDPCTGYFGYPGNGTYRWVSIDDFKKAVGRTKWPIKECRYQLLIFENKTESAFDDEYIHELIHTRNIEKSIGIISSYDGVFTDDIFRYYGIEAIEEFRDDLKFKFERRLPIHKILMKTNIVYLFNDPIKLFRSKSEFEELNKKYLSNYLYENKHLNVYYEKDSVLLERESKCWENITDSLYLLLDVVNNNSMFKANKLSKPLISEIVNQLDGIIAIRKMIIDDSVF